MEQDADGVETLIEPEDSHESERWRQINHMILSNVRIDKETGCWLWTGTRTSEGRPQLSLHGKLRYPLKAQRVAFTQLHGFLAPQEPIYHSCENRMDCVNPFHMFGRLPEQTHPKRVYKGGSFKRKKKTKGEK